MTERSAIAIDAADVERMIMELGAIGAHSGTGVWRTVYSPEWVEANDALCALVRGGRARGQPRRRRQCLGEARRKRWRQIDRLRLPYRHAEARRPL